MLIDGFFNIGLGEIQKRPMITIKKLNDLDSNVEVKNYMAYILGREQRIKSPYEALDQYLSLAC